MADVIVTQDPTKPGVNKLNGPPIVNGKVPLTSISTTGANPNDVITLQGGNWTPVAQAGVESASNLGAGSQVFKSKVGTDFQFRSIIGTSGITVTQNANDITLSGGGAFTAAFTSANQTITAGGPLTIAHGLTGVPTLVQCTIKCTSADLGYSVNDVLFVGPGHHADSESEGMSIVPDATNLNVRFGSAAGVFDILNKSNGNRGVTDATKWQLIIRAWL